MILIPKVKTSVICELKLQQQLINMMTSHHNNSQFYYRTALNGFFLLLNGFFVCRLYAQSNFILFNNLYPYVPPFPSLQHILKRVRVRFRATFHLTVVT